MLLRLARSFAIATKLPVAQIRRMPRKAESAGTTDQIQTTGLQPKPRLGGVQANPPSLPRRSSRPRSTLQSPAVLAKAAPYDPQAVSSLAASTVDQDVKQESPDNAQPAVATMGSAPNQINTSRSRKRKAAADADADAVDTAPPVVVDSKQAASKPAVSLKEAKRKSKGSAKVKPTQTADPASADTAGLPAFSDTPASTGAAGSALQLPADSPTQPAKQRKPRSKAVIKTETVTVANPPGKQVSAPAVTQEDGESPASGTSKKLRKQRTPPTQVEVKTEVATVAEPRDDPPSAQDPAVMPEGSVTAKKPRKRRAKAEVSVETLLESVHVTPYRERVMPKKWVGAHVSMGGGMERAVVRAAAIGANAFAMDTRSKRQWESKPMSTETADSFKQACKDYGFGPEHILPHGSYLINLASAKPELLQKSYTAFVEELKRCEMLGIGLYNFHPGSTCGECPAEEGMARIADSINKAHAETESVIIVLENMAGGGGSVGHRFDYLQYVIDRVKNKSRVGVCLDTCHLFAGGYDVSTTETFEQVMEEFGEVVGLQYLKGMHVNDSKAALGSKKDRHENVAKGLIGKECFEFLMNDSRFDGIPLIMETPVQCPGPDIDFKLSLLAGAPVFKTPKPGEEEKTEENTDKRDIAWLNSLSRS